MGEFCFFVLEDTDGVLVMELGCSLDLPGGSGAWSLKSSHRDGVFVGFVIVSMVYVLLYSIPNAGVWVLV